MRSALALLLYNRKQASMKFGVEFHHTPPNPHHYPHLYLWDSCFCSIIFARLGKPSYAIEEITKILRGQDESGFIPGTRFVAPSGRRFDPERLFFKNKNFGSDYTQPPVLALAVYEVYKNLLKKNKQQAVAWLKSVFFQLDKYYDFILNTRKGRKGLIYCIHPHETGRDSDPTFDVFKNRLRRDGVRTSKAINFLNSLLDYAGALLINQQIKRARWRLTEIKKRVWFADVMFNCMLVDNLQVMSDLAGIVSPRKVVYYKKLAVQLEQNILHGMYDKKDGLAYAQTTAGALKTVSISNLFALTLPHLPERYLMVLLDLLEDESWFNTPYLIPSVPANSDNFDPHYGEKGRLWRGPAWVNANWYLYERGLLLQISRRDLSLSTRRRLKKLAIRLKSSTQSLVKRGYCEFYDPLSGQGYRVQNFAMSALAAVFE